MHYFREFLPSSPDCKQKKQSVLLNGDYVRNRKLLSLETQRRIANESWLEWRRKNGRRKKLKCKR